MDKTDDADRRIHVRNAVIFVLAALVLLLLALLLFSGGPPDWNPDGSRAAYPAWIRALICVCLVSGTVSMPLALRSLVLALLPSGALGIVLGVLVGVASLVVVPLELWIALGVTSEAEPGTQARYESDDWDWDWD